MEATAVTTEKFARDETEKFRANFAEWGEKLKTDGETDEGIAEIKSAINAAWKDKEMRDLWIVFVAAHARGECVVCKH